MMQLELYDRNGIQYLPGFHGLRFDKLMESGEDVSCSFVLDRSSRLDYPDVGYEHEVVLRKGLNPLWSGHMRYIDQDEETITVKALGNWVHLHDLTYIGGGATPGTIGRLWSDTRYGRWKPVLETMANGPRPQRYQMDNQNRLFIAPRKNENFGTPAPNQGGAYYYYCEYDAVKRVTFNYDFVDPDSWEIHLYSNNGTPWAWGADNNEWSLAATAAGAANLNFANARNFIHFYLFYNALKANYGGETGVDCYVNITDLKLYGTADTTPTVTDVASDIVAQLSAGGLISSDTALIEAVAVTLEPLFYESGESCMDALKDAASFGDANYRALAWGVESGGDRVFVRAPDRDAVRYVIPASQAIDMSVQGGTNEDFVTEGWGSYTDEEGITRYTAKYYAHVTRNGIVVNATSTGDDLASVVYGIQRDRVVNFGRVDTTLATVFIQRYLMEHAHPQVLSRWTITGPVQDLMRGGGWIEPYEMQTGWLVQVPHFRAVEAEGTAGVDLREWETTFMLAGLSWNDDNQAMQLIPEGAATDLKRIKEFARRFIRQEEQAEFAKRTRVLGA